MLIHACTNVSPLYINCSPHPKYYEKQRTWQCLPNNKAALTEWTDKTTGPVTSLCATCVTNVQTSSASRLIHNRHMTFLRLRERIIYLAIQDMQDQRSLRSWHGRACESASDVNYAIQTDYVSQEEKQVAVWTCSSKGVCVCVCTNTHTHT